MPIFGRIRSTTAELAPVLGTKHVAFLRRRDVDHRRSGPREQHAFYIANDTDYFTWRDLRSRKEFASLIAANHDSLAYRISTLPPSARQRFVDQSHGKTSSAIGLQKRAPFENRNAHRLEIVFADGADFCAAKTVLVVIHAEYLNWHICLPSQGSDRYHRSGTHPRKALDPLQ